ncbi:type I restriction enzyme HsdR N-terminal domain-containing protein [Aquimarina rhabdastrellae]
MQNLNFPAYNFRFKNSENKTSIFDPIRKKFIILTPEEWVRQHTVNFLMHEKNYPKSLINVEKKVDVNGMQKRYDIIVFHPDGRIHIIIECKAPKVTISQDTFDQIARYNLSLHADYLMVTNGLSHYYCQMDFEQECYHFLREIPNYSSL